jgi:hypothetical protein
MMPSFRALLSWYRLSLSRQITEAFSLLGVSRDNPHLWYTIGYMIFWVLVVWSWIVDNTYHLNYNLSIHMLEMLRFGAPFVVTGFALLMVTVLALSFPFRVRASVINYIVSSPADRASIAWVSLLQSATPFLVVSAMAACVGSMMLNWRHLTPVMTGNIGLFTLLLTPIFVSAFIAMSWSLSLVPLMPRTLLRLFWSLVIVCVLSGTLLTLHHTSRSALTGQWYILDVALILLVFVAAFLSLAGIAKQISMLEIIERSRVYARIAGLNRLFYADLIERIHLQAQLARRQSRSALRLPGNISTEVARSLHAWRNRWWRLSLSWIIGPITFAMTLLLIQGLSGEEQLQGFIFYTMFLIFTPPRHLVTAYLQVQDNRFMRQFYAENNLQLFLQSSALPLLTGAAAITACSVAYLGSGVQGVFGAFVLCGVYVLLALCQTLPHVNLERFRLGRLSYDQLLAISAFVIILTQIVANMWLLTSGIVVVLIVVFGFLLYRSS